MTPFLLDLARRQRRPELMDDPAIDPREFEQALRGIERLNRFSAAARLAWPLLRRLAAQGPVHALDLATGGGDLPRRLTRRARRARLAIRIDGCDQSPLAIARAEALSAGALRFFELDVLRDPLPRGYDWIGTTLFLHHLETDDALSLLGRMRACARRAVFVCDLERSSAGHALAWTATRLLTRSRVARMDGPLSVAGAFRIEEVRELADEAGLVGARIERRLPFRWTLEWEREPV